MQTSKRIVAVILSFGFVLATTMDYAGAHSGRTDRYGCHEVTATGSYHCHYGGGYSGGGSSGGGSSGGGSSGGGSSGGKSSGGSSSGEDFLIAASIIVGVVIVFWVLRNCDRDLNLREEIQTAEPRLKPFYNIEENEFGLKLTTPF